MTSLAQAKAVPADSGISERTIEPSASLSNRDTGSGGVKPSVSPVEVTLPIPPSVNNLYANVRGRGRVRSQRYRAWANVAGFEVKAQKPGKIKGPVNIFVTIEKRDNRKRDLDGMLKAPIDLIVDCGLIEDDSLVQQITAKWSRDPLHRGCRVSIWPAPVHGEAA